MELTLSLKLAIMFYLTATIWISKGVRTLCALVQTERLFAVPLLSSSYIKCIIDHDSNCSPFFCALDPVFTALMCFFFTIDPSVSVFID